MGVVGRRGERGVVDYGAMTVVLVLLVYFYLVFFSSFVIS